MGKEFTAEEKRLRDIIIEWAKEKAAQGEIEFKECFCREKHISYRTKETTRLIQEKSVENYDRNRYRIIYWKKPEPPYHYVYEIGIDSEKNKLYLQLVFNYTGISDVTRKICDHIYNNYRYYPRKDDLTRDYRRVRYFDANIEKAEDKAAIEQKMEQLFSQMKEYETFIIYHLREKS